ncbi:uncharacterized protein LOC116347869 isoform X1 [Contarinia nasturtii]|uniref:uncharacterized protein LOC116347869 isoform X1 n=1 Tax=Contarinia nasturtii TaxID=265458 RepID=UPI0012D490D4|nr:uncharacterized protein LOC116347869 isoform X1 [Contarinia nasturtii]XP_031634490.1 uncharacterized protein LOC116347869 isoform X1 [Contarinia nasturtii]
MYTPVPQNMTDSESEEEFRLQINDCKLKNMTNTHHNLATEADADNVAILNTHLKKSQPMTMLRRVVFILSIFGCIFTVMLFVWMLPCTDSNSCPAKSERIYTHNWLRNYERIELKGAINVVNGVRRTSKNLVFMYRKKSFFKNDNALSGTSSKQNGIISLVGSSGAVAWYDELKNEPIDADCNLFDADSNGETDCLIVDSIGEVFCINPLSGFRIWHINSETNIPKKPNFPLVLPDINLDGIKDLLISSTTKQLSNKNETFNVLKLISGANGEQIGRNYVVQKCSFIHRFHINATFKISFNCIINDTDIRVTIRLQEIFEQATDKTIDLPEENIEIEQHKFYGQRKDTLRQRNIYSVNEKQLIVENYGVCPELCNTTVMILENNEDQKGKPKILKYFNGTRMYGMVPARLSFNNSHDQSKSSIHGFVIKFWEWSIINNTNITDKPFYTANRNVFSNNHKDLNDFNRFNNSLRKKRSWNTLDSNLNVVKSSNKLLPEKIASQMRIIKETIVLIIFNSTDIRIENTSQSNIVQFCYNDGERNICQPDLNYQENSVLITDLDQDGSQELVNFWSTFIENENEWKLRSHVNVIKCSEMNKY